jgi:uncharacterized protein YyaL (SSP411 family)
MMPGRYFTLALLVTLPAAVPLAHGANRLAGERSPYLLQHANNPVDWFPWGEEAFAKARRENRPIFLSVGYSTCHWCHVMERESFSDPEIAAFLNDHFVNIKVDREERPDVDRVHMAFVQAATGRGGWPMSVWLTPDIKPFAGGTYYPPRDSGGQAGFLTVLRHIAGEWRDDERGVRARADMVAAGLARLADGPASANGNPAPGTEILEAARAALARQFDREEGGFGRAPKFPSPVEPSANTVSALNLLRLSHLLGDPALGERAEKALAYLGATLRASPLAAPMGLIAMDRALSPSRQIVLVGPRDAAPTRQMIRTIWARFQPGAVWALLHDGASRKFFGTRAPFFAGLPEFDERPTAYICENFTCGLPTDDPVEFEARLSGRDAGRPRD